MKTLRFQNIVILNFSILNSGFISQCFQEKRNYKKISAHCSDIVNNDWFALEMFISVVLSLQSIVNRWTDVL